MDEKNEHDEEQEDSGRDAKKIRLPIMMEFVFSLSPMLLICVALVVAGLSYISGANIIDIFLRTVISTLVIGIVLWFISYQVSMGTLGAVYSEKLGDVDNLRARNMDEEG